MSWTCIHATCIYGLRRLIETLKICVSVLATVQTVVQNGYQRHATCDICVLMFAYTVQFAQNSSNTRVPIVSSCKRSDS
jgi:hypothetical protein